MMKSIQEEVTTTMRTLLYFLVITDMNHENQNLDKSNQIKEIFFVRSVIDLNLAQSLQF